MKKTLISFLLALCLAFTFMIAGCNKNQDGNNTPVTPPEASEPEKPEKPVLPEIPEIADDSQPLPVPAGEPTASLTYEKIGNAYAVTGETANAANIVIPAEHDGLPVTTVRESAFAYSRHNGDILSVTIPDSVTAIERNTFYNRDETTNVYIGADSKLTTIGNNAFSGNHSLGFIYIPSGVTEIGDSALITAAQLTLQCLRETAFTARITGI